MWCLLAACKTFKCHICGVLFATKGSLKVHMRLHTGAKPFECPQCPMHFRTSGHRKSHISSHLKHDSSGKHAIVRRKSSAQASRHGQLGDGPLHRQEEEDDRGLEHPQPSTPFIILSAGDVQAVQQQSLAGQLMDVDQSMLQTQNVIPMSLNLPDNGSGNGASQVGRPLVFCRRRCQL